MVSNVVDEVWPQLLRRLAGMLSRGRAKLTGFGGGAERAHLIDHGLCHGFKDLVLGGVHAEHLKETTNIDAVRGRVDLEIETVLDRFAT